MLHWFGVTKLVLELIGTSWTAIAYDKRGEVVGTGQARMRMTAYVEACMEAKETWRASR